MGETLGLRGAMIVVGAAAVAIAAVVALLSPIGRLRGLPAAPEPALTESLAEETTF